MLTIYYKPHSKRVREAVFVEHLKMAFPQARLVLDNFRISPTYLDRFVQTSDILAALEADNLLPKQPRQHCLDLLATCPSQIKIARDPGRILFDVVVEQDDQIYYWEFHEEQHWKLTVTRIQTIYDAGNNAPIPVPRYLQRLIRDIWRVMYFHPYTIVWHDWFARHQREYRPELREGFHELYLPGTFSFSTFCNISTA
jgi:hypothetical protein